MRFSRQHRHLLAAAVVAVFFIIMAMIGFQIADRSFLFRTASSPLKHDDSSSESADGGIGAIKTTDAKGTKSKGWKSGKGPTQKDLDRTEKEIRLLRSKRNGMGVFNSINVNQTGLGIMNPTLLELPRGSQHDFLVIARAFHVDVIINDIKYKKARQVATFANLTYNHPLHPELVAGEWSRFLVEDFMGPEHHCKKKPAMDKYIGPEDMKIFWTRKRVPLIVFTHQTPDEVLCEGMFAIDARAAVPELVDALGPHALDLPEIKIRTPAPLRRTPPPGHEEDQAYQREKNWAPVQSPLNQEDDGDDDVYFMVEPSQLFRWRPESNGTVEEVPAQRDSSVEVPYQPGLSAEWHSEKGTCINDVMLSNGNVHQSTPMLSLTLCDRGTCEPSADNTVLLGMVQRRYDPPGVYRSTWYERHIVAYSAAPPYAMMSVSKVLSYHGEVKNKYIWTGGMVYLADSPGIPFNRSHGYLDDEIWLSFGIRDKAAGWIDVDAKELIKDHYFCSGATRGYRDSVASNVS